MPASPSKSWVLLTLLAILALASAIDLDGIAHYMHYNNRAAAAGTGVSSSAAAATSTPAASQPSTAAASSTPDSSSETPSPSSVFTSATPSSATPAPSSASAVTSGDASSTPASSKADSTTDASKATKTSQQPSLYTSALVQTSIQQYVTLTTIVSGSQTLVQSETLSRTVEQTTGFATSTAVPVTNSNSSSSSGMSTKTKSIIGGVVGGVGGAILLGGLALVAWRVWGRKKRVSDDDNDLMMGTGSAVGEKPNQPQSTPFQTNLEQYHNPGGRPNAAANF